MSLALKSPAIIVFGMLSSWWRLGILFLGTVGEVSGGMYMLIMFMYCVCPVLILMDFASAVYVCVSGVG